MKGSERPPRSAPARLKAFSPAGADPRETAHRLRTGPPRFATPALCASLFIGVCPYTPTPLSCSLFDRAAGTILPCIVLRPDRHPRTVTTSGEQQRPTGLPAAGTGRFLPRQKYRTHLLLGASTAVRSPRSDQKTYRRMPVQYCTLAVQSFISVGLM